MWSLWYRVKQTYSSIIREDIKHLPLFIRLHWKLVTIIIQQQWNCRKNWSFRRIKKNPTSTSSRVYQRGFRQRTNLFRFGGNFKSSSQNVILCRKELLIRFISVFHISAVANNKKDFMRNWIENWSLGLDSFKKLVWRLRNEILILSGRHLLVQKVSTEIEIYQDLPKVSFFLNLDWELDGWSIFLDWDFSICQEFRPWSPKKFWWCQDISINLKKSWIISIVSKSFDLFSQSWCKSWHDLASTGKVSI